MKGKSHRTMDDFAKASGISRPTLSKYFDDPDSVRPGTRTKIEAALRSSDYQPNHYARNLNRKRTRNVGVIVPSITDPFYAEVVSQIELRCIDAGYWPIVISSHGSPQLEARAIRTLQSLKVSGSLVAPLGLSSDLQLLERFSRDIPIVYFDNAIEGKTPFVGNNNEQSISTIVDYLCRTGQPPAYMEVPAVNHNSTERRDSYVAAMTKLGLEPVVMAAPAVASWDFERIGYEQMERILDEKRLATDSILCGNDRLAFGVMAAAFARRLKVGRDPGWDIRIAAHDDHPLSRYTCPPLTTMAQDIAGLAARSTDILLALMDGDLRHPDAGENRIILDAKLVMRQSA